MYFVDHHYQYNQVRRITQIVKGSEDTLINKTIEDEQQRDAAYNRHLEHEMMRFDDDGNPNH